MNTTKFNDVYTEGREARIAYPLGGIGAGMIALEGTGALSHVSLRGRPEFQHQPLLFSAVTVLGEKPQARLLEGPVPNWKVFDAKQGPNGGAAGGQNGRNYGLPRMKGSSFTAKFPFGTIQLADPALPVEASLTGWSPFIPSDPDSSSLPMAGLEYSFKNTSGEPVELVYSFHAYNFLAVEANSAEVRETEGGFVLAQAPIAGNPWAQAAFSATAGSTPDKVGTGPSTSDPALDTANTGPNTAGTVPDTTGTALDTAVHTRWFEGPIWFDALTVLWKTIEQAGVPPYPSPDADQGRSGPGGSLYVPVRLQPGEEKRITLRLSWFVPVTDQRHGSASEEVSGFGEMAHQPWYASRFAHIGEVEAYWREQYNELRSRTERFADSLYRSDVPGEIVEAVAANLTILKSPTVMRQLDGRLWAWEGCMDTEGSCYGTCTHVWNYAQAVPHLFASLERGMRESELAEGQDESGHQAFRLPLPIVPAKHDYYAAADGQLGGIMKVYREWRIGGDLHWLRARWPQMKLSLQYCIDAWDPDRLGVLVEPHHNTYDIEFWGPDPMCSSIYIGALKAASLICNALGEDGSAYLELYRKGRAYMESELFNGEYFEQRTMWGAGVRAQLPELGHDAGNVQYSASAYEIFKQEGPKYQYGQGCLADGLLGAWLAATSGLGDILDPQKVKSHLLSVFKYNFKPDLSEQANPQRPGFGLGREAGLLLCTWPHGGEPTLPLQYSYEVWSGIEYQVASHLMLAGAHSEALAIVRACRSRYDGWTRNPFAEYECGLWYARAMASYALLGAYFGIRYDAVEKTMYMRNDTPDDFCCFLSTATGFGVVGRKDGVPYAEAVEGAIEVQAFELE